MQAANQTAVCISNQKQLATVQSEFSWQRCMSEVALTVHLLTDNSPY